MMGVTALTGIMLPPEAAVHITWQSSATAMPHSIVHGNSHLWSSLESSRRAMWGTARPMKAIGPQNAVATAVSHPVMTSSR